MTTYEDWRWLHDILQIHAQTSMWNYNLTRWIILLRNITNNVTITKRVPCPVERVGGLKSELSLCHVILALRSKTGVQEMHVQQKWWIFMSWHCSMMNNYRVTGWDKTTTIFMLLTVVTSPARCHNVILTSSYGFWAQLLMLIMYPLVGIIILL